MKHLQFAALINPVLVFNDLYRLTETVQPAASNRVVGVIIRGIRRAIGQDMRILLLRNDKRYIPYFSSTFVSMLMGLPPSGPVCFMN